ncbi:MULTISPECIES: hypothetical protein [Aquimarina]|nr:MULTISPECIES: hypothetical protein [Aquimarina]
MSIISIRFVQLTLLCSMLFITSCKTVLAPEYDKAIVESVSVTSQKTMSFVASVSNGVTQETFKNREPIYNYLIGAFDALKLQARARPVPRNVATKQINKLLKIKGHTTVKDEYYPSAFAFQKIAETLTKMKDTDRSKGIKPFAVEAFKGQIEIFLDQAITYESFLKR